MCKNHGVPLAMSAWSSGWALVLQTNEVGSIPIALSYTLY